jgi:transcriptional regulator with XRE-family HTH domain
MSNNLSIVIRKVGSMNPSAQELLVVRKRILGVLLRDAREASGHSPEDLSDLLGIPVDEYKRFEMGDHSPTLPQLEVLAYYFNIPIKHFWGANTLAESQKERNIKERVAELTVLRQKVIGARLRQLREQAGLTPVDVANRAGLSTHQIDFIERGQLPVPVTLLERVANAVNSNVDDLMDGHGTVGNWLVAQEQFDEFSALPPELRTFIVRPINRSYLELAIRLSNMKVDQLRTIAESILEITY